MQLLAPTQVKKDDNKAQESQRLRIAAMNRAETEIAKSLNLKKEKAAIEGAKIEASVSEKRLAAKVVCDELDGKIGSKKAELAELMKPIEEVRVEADERLADVVKREEAVKRSEDGVISDLEEISERTEALVDREQVVAEQEESLDTRQKKVIEEEARIKVSENVLSEKWIEYHRDVAAASAAVARREKEVEDGRKANETVRAQQEKRKEEQDSRERQLQDQYATLTRARQEFEKLQNT